MNINQMSYQGMRPQNSTTRIVISISSQLLAEGLNSMLKNNGYDVEVFGRTATFHEIAASLKRPESLLNTVWILDIKTLVSVVPASQRSMIKNRAIIVADTGTSRKSKSYLSSAAAIVSTECAFQELEYAVRAVVKGNRYFDQRLSHFRVEEFNTTTPDLTARQLQVLKMVADGMSSRTIANELLLSRRTVENHRARILERLGVNTAAEMITIARDNNWI